MKGFIISTSPPPPNLFEPGAFKPGQGLPSLTRGFQGRPGASKPEAPRDFDLDLDLDLELDLDLDLDLDWPMAMSQAP